MGLLSHRVERSEIKARRPHLHLARASYAYSHHGIYVGGSKVVHFTRKKEAGTTGLDSAIAVSSLLSPGSDECPTFPDCGFQLPDSGVILTCLDCFLRGGALHRFEYGVPPAVFLAKLRGGTCTTARADAADAAVRRAMHLLQNGFGDYDVFENNCEDFALYCKTGLLPAAGRRKQPGIERRHWSEWPGRVRRRRAPRRALLHAVQARGPRDRSAWRPSPPGCTAPGGTSLTSE
ncbi:hypothetical protein PR202_ga21712 [Eleusine coracana subsp. coracana]|uniref:LRAT domain-containing protein n=1 Tax=Eleusine coracana subsp. coracana TaxID=191504 RepID=A0AAV5D1I4_ELECO|nr:hypothetical protein PR202_ga21712 [Eleusine coracana subsp. coracana]